MNNADTFVCKHVFSFLLIIHLRVDLLGCLHTFACPFHQIMYTVRVRTTSDLSLSQSLNSNCASYTKGPLLALDDFAIQVIYVLKGFILPYPAGFIQSDLPPSLQDSSFEHNGLAQDGRLAPGGLLQISQDLLRQNKTSAQTENTDPRRFLF